MIEETIPNAGKARIYTSGCPKNQKICWNKTGSPPPAALKKLVPKYLSVRSIVTAPAKTGNEAINKNEVITQVQTNNGICINDIPGARILNTVAIILIAPIIEDIPRKWTANMRNGNASPVCNTKGGYIVHPPAGPPPCINIVLKSNAKANGSIQKLMLFILGKAISGAPIIKGIIQFARPTPAGITAPNIMTSAWMVTIEL